MEQSVGVVEQEQAIEPTRETSVTSRTTVVRDQPATVAHDLPMHSQEISEIVAALSLAHGAFGDFERAKTADAGKYKYRYEDMADIISAVRPALSANGLIVLQMPTTARGALALTTILAHTSGQWFQGRLTLACDTSNPQAVGSAISYARRYALKAMLMLAPGEEDDDGALASAKPGPPRPAQRVSTKPQGVPAPPPGALGHGESASPTVGKIASLTERGSGLLVKLDSGLTCATRDAAMIAAVKKLHASGATVEVTVTPSALDPAKYAPTLTELSPVRE